MSGFLNCPITNCPMSPWRVNEWEIGVFFRPITIEEIVIFMILQVYSPASIERCAKLQNSIIFRFIGTNKVVFDAVFSNLCIIY